MVYVILVVAILLVILGFRLGPFHTDTNLEDSPYQFLISVLLVATGLVTTIHTLVWIVVH